MKIDKTILNTIIITIAVCIGILYGGYGTSERIMEVWEIACERDRAACEIMDRHVADVIEEQRNN